MIGALTGAGTRKPLNWFNTIWKLFHFRASNVDGSVTSRKANLDIAVLRGEFPEEPLDTWVAQRGEVSRVLCIPVFTVLRWNCLALLPRATLPQKCPGAGMESPST